jgi:hypothetical protein
MTQLDTVPDLVESPVGIAQYIVPRHGIKPPKKEIHCFIVTRRLVADACALVQAPTQKHNRFSSQACLNTYGRSERDHGVTSLEQAVRVDRIFRFHKMHSWTG